MEKDGTQMEGCHSVRMLGFVRGGTNDRFICMYQQRRRVYYCFLTGVRIIRFHRIPGCDATGTSQVRHREQRNLNIAS